MDASSVSGDSYVTTLAHCDAAGRGHPTHQMIGAYVAASPIAAPRFLDVGSGAGIYSRAVAEACPSAHLTCVDQPAMRPCLEQTLTGPATGGRVEIRCGDIFTTDWGRDYDMVLFSHLLHGFPVGDCARLVAKAARALKPGGTLIIHEFVPDPEAPASTPIPALFSLEMLLTSHGDAYPAATYDQLLQEAGFTATTALPSPMGATQILTAELLPALETEVI